MNTTIESLVEYLMECDLTQNDATVYLWLLKNQVANPSKISKGTGIQRPRVYDSLKRLIERGFVIQEVGQKRPSYTVSDSRTLLMELQSMIDSKIEARNMIKEQIVDQLPQKVRGIFFFNDEKALRLKIQTIMEKSQKKITIIAIFPFAIKDETFIFPELLGKKGLEGQEITLLLNINEKNWESCSNMFENKIKIYHYPHLAQVSTIMHLIDDDTLFISTLKKQKKKKNLEFGIFFSGDQNIITAFDFLIQGFIQQSITLQKRFEELKKSIIYPSEKLKTIFGVEK